ncbi:hypothetical protein RJT34_17750 [Clitoria ternatea]|uniref:Uncharacterized protein n=1 Tax=Clitoria ternatea TaxID=43366 RepID=A0AAN9JBQ8_CLITE
MFGDMGSVDIISLLSSEVMVPRMGVKFQFFSASMMLATIRLLLLVALSLPPIIPKLNLVATAHIPLDSLSEDRGCSMLPKAVRTLYWFLSTLLTHVCSGCNGSRRARLIEPLHSSLNSKVLLLEDEAEPEPGEERTFGTSVGRAF